MEFITSHIKKNAMITVTQFLKVVIFSHHKSVPSSRGMGFQFLASNDGEQNVQQDLLIGQTGGKSRLGP